MALGRGRRVAADQRVPRRDGRRMGAVRGVGEDPARRCRLGAGVFVRQDVAGRPRGRAALQLDPYCLAPLWPDADSIGRPPGARCTWTRPGKTERDLAEVAARAGATAATRTRRVRSSSTAAREAYRFAAARSRTVRPTATARRDGDRAGDLAQQVARDRRGSAASTIASSRPRSARATSRRRRRPRSRRRRPAWARNGSTWPSSTRPTPIRS